MKRYDVNGGDLFPFAIPKITSRDVRLLERFDPTKDSFCTDAEQNLRTVQGACDRLAKKYGVSYSTELSLPARSAHVGIFLPLWNLRHEEWEILNKLRPHLIGASAKPFAFGLKILFKVRYFPRQESRIERDLEEIYRHYVEK